MKNQCRRSRHTGFTLVELMIAVAIIGILATMAINEYDKNAARAKFAEMIRSSSSIKTDIIEYYGTHGELPPTTAWRDFDNDDNMPPGGSPAPPTLHPWLPIVIAPTDSVYYPGSNSNRRLHIEVNTAWRLTRLDLRDP